MGNVLVIDIGTSSMKGVLYDRFGKIQQMFQVQYSPEYLPSDRVEQDPRDWKNALIDITSEAVKWSQE